MTSTLFFLGLLALGYGMYKLNEEKKELARSLHKYKSLISREEEEKRLDLEINYRENLIRQLDTQEKDTINRIDNLERHLGKLREEEHLQDLGFYEPKYNFYASEDYEMRFKQLTAERKKMIKLGRSVFCHKKLTVDNDMKAGQLITKSHLIIVQKAFDLTCDSSIKNARTGNINRLKNKIESNFNWLNKSSKVLECEISSEYLNLRLLELDVKYEMELKKQEEKERARIRNEKRRQEKKERESIENARREEEEAEEREKEYEIEREKIKRQLEKATGKKLEELERKKNHYEQLIAEAQKDKSNAIYRYRQIKSGNIYVTSNEGSLGKDIYRIQRFLLP